jgi:hypothetical protein
MPPDRKPPAKALKAAAIAAVVFVIAVIALIFAGYNVAHVKEMGEEKTQSMPQGGDQRTLPAK